MFVLLDLGPWILRQLTIVCLFYEPMTLCRNGLDFDALAVFLLLVACFHADLSDPTVDSGSSAL